ncbi:tyrosine-type recombinase/integrase [Nocardia sp. NPDC004654]|uniref:tyrosine-type recombinase/integrase n=1 Tax=Nocardia sp. NPDC004654 TaxID=3154776 RepID=UPI0033B9ADBF
MAKTGLPGEAGLSDRQIARIIQTRGKAAGYPDLRGHSLRAGGATEAFERGADLTDVMALGGWSNPASALRYDRARERRSVRVDLGI